MNKLHPYACLNIDCSFIEWLRGVRRGLYTNESGRKLSLLIAKYFSTSDNVLVCISVRTAYDLYLSALKLPKGSEVLMTAVNIPEMVRITRAHGYIPVPVDIDPATLEADPRELESYITPRTKMIIVAFVFGCRGSLEGISAVARRHNLLVFEDCAEGFVGESYQGNSLADASVFSFGPIKHSTAFGGGVIVVRNNENLVNQMRCIHNAYPVQSNTEFLKKVLKTGIGMLMMNNKAVNRTVRPIARVFDYDLKKKVVEIMRGFKIKTGVDFYHFRPSPALLSFLYRRLKNFNSLKFKEDMAHVQRATDLLTEKGVFVPGYKNKDRVYWLYPITTPDPDTAYKDLNDSGIDSYQGVSQLNYVPKPVGSSYREPEKAIEMFKNMLYLPIHIRVPPKDIDVMARKSARLINPKL